jgi:site-specific DNA-methyltransferase (cytosine-N4-specific)
MSESNSSYLRLSKELGLKSHPARFPSRLPEFFIKFLTDEGDLVVDIFSGSNTAGEVAERMGRRWLAFDNDLGYVANSSLRFIDPDYADKMGIVEMINKKECVDLAALKAQQALLPVDDRFFTHLYT